MKLRAIAAALLVAALGASVALADGGGGHGRGEAHGKARAEAVPSAAATGEEHGRGNALVCRPSIELEVAGTAAAAPSGGLLAVLVTRGGSQGQQLAGKQVTFDVSQAHVSGTIAANAPVRVHARACVDLVALTVKLVATQVSAGSGGGHDGTSSATGSTSTTTSTTSSTTTNGG